MTCADDGYKVSFYGSFPGSVFAAHSTRYRVLFFLLHQPVVCLICYCTSTLIGDVFPDKLSTQARPSLSLDHLYRRGNLGTLPSVPTS